MANECASGYIDRCSTIVLCITESPISCNSAVILANNNTTGNVENCTISKNSRTTFLANMVPTVDNSSGINWGGPICSARFSIHSNGIVLKRL